MGEHAGYHDLSCPPTTASDGTKRTIAMGKFDGIHIAHQAVLRLTVERARKSHSRPCIFSFDPHPRFVLAGDLEYARWLTPPAERHAVAQDYGITETYVARFDTAFQQQTAEEFVENYLLPLGATELVVGYDFHLGKNGTSGVADLSEIAQRVGIGVHVLPHIDDEQAPVSSSRIRMELAAGNLIAAIRLLGRPYRLRGRVVQGDQRGRTIGFPTANLDLTEAYVLPKEGVYVVQGMMSSQPIYGVMNIGRRPTVYDRGGLSIEVHWIDLSADLYGETLIVDLLHYVRNERAFSSLDELQARLREDVMVARAVTAELSSGR